MVAKFFGVSCRKTEAIFPKLLAKSSSAKYFKFKSEPSGRIKFDVVVPAEKSTSTIEAATSAKLEKFLAVNRKLVELMQLQL